MIFYKHIPYDIWYVIFHMLDDNDKENLIKSHNYMLCMFGLELINILKNKIGIVDNIVHNNDNFFKIEYDAKNAIDFRDISSCDCCGTFGSNIKKKYTICYECSLNHKKQKNIDYIKVHSDHEYSISFDELGECCFCDIYKNVNSPACINCRCCNTCDLLINVCHICKIGPFCNYNDCFDIDLKKCCFCQ